MNRRGWRQMNQYLFERNEQDNDGREGKHTVNHGVTENEHSIPIFSYERALPALACCSLCVKTP